MSFCKDWYPEEPVDEVNELAKDLLKGKLDEVFSISQNRHRERMMKEKGNVFNNVQGEENER